MKKQLLFLLTLLLAELTYAKKVTFRVDMAGQTVSAMGIHVMGDFQDEAGLGADWTPNGATMTNATGSMYELTVDIPAFRMYEYKFVNGDQSYEVEVIPEKAQVGYQFNDNRWIYIDSLANDTTQLPLFLFGSAAPSGQIMVRLIVDMTTQSVNTSGVHIAGDFQGWNPATLRIGSLVANVYETILYVSPSTTINYKFYNGNTIAAAESVPNACAVSGNRSVTALSDTVISMVCFSSCSSCFPASVASNTLASNVVVYPNPAKDAIHIEADVLLSAVSLYDMTGRLVYKNSFPTEKINVSGLPSGVYMLQIKTENDNSLSQRILVR